MGAVIEREHTSETTFVLLLIFNSKDKANLLCCPEIQTGMDFCSLLWHFLCCLYFCCVKEMLRAASLWVWLLKAFILTAQSKPLFGVLQLLKSIHLLRSLNGRSEVNVVTHWTDLLPLFAHVNKVICLHLWPFHDPLAVHGRACGKRPRNSG